MITLIYIVSVFIIGSIVWFIRRLLAQNHNLFTENAKLSIENRQIRNTQITCKPQSLSGVFEIHVTIDPHNNFVSLLNYVKQYEKMRGMKVVFAVSSAKNNQYMLSYFTRKDDDKLAVDSANKTAAELRDLGIEVIRVKVEGHNAEGTPMTTEDYKLVKSYLQSKYDTCASQPYFEFHVKVSNRENDHLNYDILESDVRKYSGVSISHNLCSADRKPLLTIRVHDDGFLNAQSHKDYVMNDMKKIGYVFGDKIHQEFAVYDSNISTDHGWL